MSGQDNGRDVMAAVRAVRDKANGGGLLVNENADKVEVTTTGVPKFKNGKLVGVE